MILRCTLSNDYGFIFAHTPGISLFMSYVDLKCLKSPQFWLPASSYCLTFLINCDYLPYKWNT